MKKIALSIIFFGLLVIGGSAFASSPNLSDVSTARKFLLSLPTECGKSYMSTLSDGSIMIKVICNGNHEGTIYIKNGKVVGME